MVSKGSCGCLQWVAQHLDSETVLPPHATSLHDLSLVYLQWEIYKWKARLNVHGRQQQYGVSYWGMYAPVITWQTMQFFFVLVLSLWMAWRNHQCHHGIHSSPSQGCIIHEDPIRIQQRLAPQGN